MDHSTSMPTDTQDFLGTTSDYILIAMITAMMMFMTLCCLCLFCRTTSRCTICGFDFEVNDEPSVQPAIEDLDEIHEVVPLTPTSRDDYHLPDIERMLQSDPPPPRYSEVASTRGSMFRWSRNKPKQQAKTLNRNQTLPDQKSTSTDERARTQRSRSLMLRRPRFSFHRSRSTQETTTMATCVEVKKPMMAPPSVEEDVRFDASHHRMKVVVDRIDENEVVEVKVDDSSQNNLAKIKSAEVVEINENSNDDDDVFV